MELRQSELFPHKIDQVFRSKKRFKTLYGGRASLKSGSIARYIALVLFACWSKDQPANAVIVRKMKETLRETVFNEMLQAIAALNLERFFSVSYSPLQIRCGNNKILFKGANGADKNLKGVTERNIRFLWLEEADQLDDFRHLNDLVATFARNFSTDFNVFVSFNPPDNKYHWIFKTLKNNKYETRKVTYLDDDKGFLSAELLDIINELKESDFELYKEIYLGEVDNKKRKYFRMCKIHDREPEPTDFVFAGIDASTTGNDKTMLSIVRYSSTDKAIYHESFEEIDTSNWLDGKTIYENIDLINDRLIEARVMFVIVDRGGGGQSIVDELTREDRPYKVKGVYFGNKPTDKTKSITFNNLRTQMFYQLSDYMNHGIVQMRKKNQEIAMNELNYFDFSKVKKEEIATKLALNSKDDIKQLLGHSPDYSDALALSVEACRFALFS